MFVTERPLLFGGSHLWPISDIQFQPADACLVIISTVIFPQGTSVCQATAIGAVVILLYTSRACYNLVVVALSPQDRLNPFNYGWFSVSDQVLPQVLENRLVLSQTPTALCVWTIHFMRFGEAMLSGVKGFVFL